MTEKLSKKATNKIDKVSSDKVIRCNLEEVSKKTYDHLDICLSKVFPNATAIFNFEGKTEQGRNIFSINVVYDNNLELLGSLEIVKSEIVANFAHNRIK